MHNAKIVLILVMQVLLTACSHSPDLSSDPNAVLSENRHDLNREITARSIKIVDRNGDIRAFIGMEVIEGLVDDVDSPEMRLINTHDKSQISMGYDAGLWPYIKISDIDGKIHGLVTINNLGELRLKSGGEKSRAEFVVKDNGTHIWMDGDNVGLYMTVTKDAARLTIRRRSGSGIALSVGSEGESKIVFIGEGGTIIREIAEDNDLK